MTKPQKTLFLHKYLYITVNSAKNIFKLLQRKKLEELLERLQ